ncbi:hypothetical protein ABTE60_21285, partial [Acinetobacter baumannii]
AALTATAFGLGATATTVDWLRSAEAAPQSKPVTQVAQAAPAVTAPTSAPLVSGLPDFSTLVEQTSPSVVNISVVGKTPQRAAMNP